MCKVEKLTSEKHIICVFFSPRSRQATVVTSKANVLFFCGGGGEVLFRLHGLIVSLITVMKESWVMDFLNLKNTFDIRK